MSQTARRTVRTTASFFADLDRQLPASAEDGGRPSRSDFATYDLLEVVERFATGWDDLQMPIPGRSGYRLLITRGRLVPAIAVVGQLASDGPSSSSSSTSTGSASRPATRLQAARRRAS